MSTLLTALYTLPKRFIWSTNAVTRSAPHIRDSNSVQRVWNTFVIASLPAWVIGLWNLGYQTNMAIADFQVEEVSGWRGQLLAVSGIGFDPGSISACLIHGLLYFIPVIVVALGVGAFWEALFARIRKKPVDEGLLVIAWLFALMLPATVPMYQVALGMTFGIVVGKLIYGGSGRYLLSPALLALVFLAFSYPSLLSGEGAWVPLSGYDQPTVLELLTDEGGLSVIAAVDYSYWQIFLGNKPGAIGVVSTLGILLGALYLVLTGVASWRIMLGAAAGFTGVALTSNAIAPDHYLYSVPWYWHMVLGGFVFGTVFIATDPVAGPMTNPGRWGFGVLVGSLTMIIRLFNPSYYEGVMFAILLACIFSPLIDFIVIELNIRRRRLRLLERNS